MPQITPQNTNKPEELVLEGSSYWDCLKELAQTPEFQPSSSGTDEVASVDVSRRQFLGLMGASVALAGMTGCRRPVQKIMPYVKQPEDIVPGVPMKYATNLPLGDEAVGVVVECHEGRPQKVEGNTLHPSSLGASDSITQGTPLSLFDPDRSDTVLHRPTKASEPATSKWETFVETWKEMHLDIAKDNGIGLAILGESSCSPTLSRLAKEYRDVYPNARWITYSPINNENQAAGLKSALGTDARVVVRYDKAKVILSLDSDFLLTESNHIAATRQFADGRRVKNRGDAMNRLYVVESTLSLTGTNADHRLAVASRDVAGFAVALAHALTAVGVDMPEAQAMDTAFDSHSDWLKAVASDLAENAGESLIVVGRRQPAAVHALAALLNQALANGDSITYAAPDNLMLSSTSDLAELAQDMKNGAVDTLIILAGNPVYDAPKDLDFANAMAKVETTIHHGLHVNETAALATWHLPATHPFEGWGDCQAWDGTAAVVQPLIRPLMNGRSVIELANLIVTGRETVSGYELVRQTWGPGHGNGPLNDADWKRVLHDGVLEDSTFDEVEGDVKGSAVAASIKALPAAAKALSADNLEVVFTVSPSVYDGRFANNGWLQELPNSITKMTWGNAALISPATAAALKVEKLVKKGRHHADIISLQLGEDTIEVPVVVMSGQADYSVSIDLGYGRTAAGKVGSGVGVGVYALRTVTNGTGFADGARATATGKEAILAITQDQFDMHDRAMIRRASHQQYSDAPKGTDPFLPARKKISDDPEKMKNLWQEHAYDKGHQWGMSIDLTTCIGCNACTIACQSENNIPVVGEDQVNKGREMHWIRVDRYDHSDSNGDPDLAYQPVPCMHCENAPCEQVCPVSATVHDKEGLNVMVYNRCIGTRYCLNNCVYKVRRFNFLNYTKDGPETQTRGPVDTEIQRLTQNPDVTVRFRGVMEKCTYCLQRINEGKRSAKLEARPLTDDDITTACEQACPAGAIVFGDINDPASRVSETRRQDRMYSVLEELNTRPRTTYLAKLRNPNPALAPAAHGTDNNGH